MFFSLLVATAFATDRHNTPQNGDSCGFTALPSLFLGDCDESTAGPDIAGNWAGSKDGSFHWERWEQCGDRVTATTFKDTEAGTRWVVHDWPSLDGSYTNGADDWRSSTLPACMPFQAKGIVNADGCIEMTSTAPAATITRCVSGNTMTWDVSMAGVDIPTTTLTRSSLSYEEARNAFEQQQAQAPQQSVEEWLGVKKQQFEAFKQTFASNKSNMENALSNVQAAKSNLTAALATAQGPMVPYFEAELAILASTEANLNQSIQIATQTMALISGKIAMIDMALDSGDQQEMLSTKIALAQYFNTNAQG